MPRPLRSAITSCILPALGAAGTVALIWRRDAAAKRHRYSKLHRAVVDLLLNALSAGDAFTERHSRRVADLTDALAHSFGLRGDRHSTLRLAALLHDMGKIDDRFFDILHSYEPLSAEQRAAISRHPYEGADILEPLEALHPGLTRIVAAHHECWDGSGYPAGLHGEQIPFEARLISVADVFDAMTQSRRYRDAADPEEAIEALGRGAGTRFDPVVVERVQRPDVLATWHAIMERGRRDEAAERGQEDEEGREKAESGSTARQ